MTQPKTIQNNCNHEPFKEYISLNKTGVRNIQRGFSFEKAPDILNLLETADYKFCDVEDEPFIQVLLICYSLSNIREYCLRIYEIEEQNLSNLKPSTIILFPKGIGGDLLFIINDAFIISCKILTSPVIQLKAASVISSTFQWLMTLGWQMKPYKILSNFFLTRYQRKYLDS